jgi:hypothetical protein
MIARPTKSRRITKIPAFGPCLTVGLIVKLSVSRRGVPAYSLVFTPGGPEMARWSSGALGRFWTEKRP